MSALAVVFGNLDPVPEAGEVKPGVFYALVIVGLVAATVFLWLSLRKQLRKVDFDEDEPERAEAGQPPPGAEPTTPTPTTPEPPSAG